MESEPRTLVEWVAHWAEKKPDVAAYHDRTGPGQWSALSWKEVHQVVRRTAKGLIALGLDKGDLVAIMAANRSDWVICQLGTQAASGVLASIYVTNTVEQVAYIVRHSGARIAICDGEELMQKYLEAEKQGLIEVDHIITMDPVKTDNPKVKSLDDVRKMGDEQPDDELDARLAAIDDDDLTMLIFTSGTTGLPKGAMYTHRGIGVISRATVERYPELAAEPDKRQISYLPLCHAAEQGLTNFGGLRLGGKIYFLADLKQIKDALTEVHPSLFLGVPRVWEKFEAALRGKFAQLTGLKAKIANWAMKKELAAFKKEAETGQPVNTFGRRMANKLFISKIKDALGLDRMLLALTGAAPISMSTLEFFASVGVILHEGYGMTETTAFATGQPLGKPRFGTIGPALPGVEIKIAEDGEILLRGDNMIKGYYKLPEKSAELWTDDGWMTTGDLGALDKDGYLSITGRKKDLIITAGGKNVAPAEIEALLQAFPGVGQAVVVGDRQPYLCALLVLDPEALPELGKEAQIPVAELEAMAQDETVRKFFQKKVDEECNPKLARYQTIKKFEVMRHPFSVETGELTPTMKVKRNIVNEKYADIISAMYG